MNYFCTLSLLTMFLLVQGQVIDGVKVETEPNESRASHWGESPILQSLADTNGWSAPEYYSTIRVLIFYDTIWLFARGKNGMQVYNYNSIIRSWGVLSTLTDLADSKNWGGRPEYYSTIRVIIFQKDFWLLARNASGLQIYQYDQLIHTWIPRQALVSLSDKNEWNHEEYYSSIQAFGLPGAIWVFARSKNGEEVHQYDLETNAWASFPVLSALSDVNKWGIDAKYYSTIKIVRLGAYFWLLGRNGDGMQLYKCEIASVEWSSMATLPELSDENGWGYNEDYSTIQAVVFGTSIWVFARNKFGVQTYQYDTDENVWNAKQSLNSLSDANNWDSVGYASTIQTVALNTSIALLARGPNGLEHYEYFPETDSWDYISDISSFSDENNWDRKEYYSTIKAINHEGTVSVVARGPSGVKVYKYGESIQLEETELVALEEEINIIESEEAELIILEVGTNVDDPEETRLVTFEEETNVSESENIQLIILEAETNADDPEETQLVTFEEETILIETGSEAIGDWTQGPALPNLADPGFDDPKYYDTIRVLSLNEAIWLFARGDDGMQVYNYNPSSGSWSIFSTLPDLNDTSEWGDSPRYYSTIQVIYYSNYFWLLTRNTEGLHLYQYNPLENAWYTKHTLTDFSGTDTWGREEYYSSIQAFGYSGKIWVFARAPEGEVNYQYDLYTERWSPPSASFVEMADRNGWNNDPKYYLTIQVVRIETRFWLFGRGAKGMSVYWFDSNTQKWDGDSMVSLPELSDENGWRKDEYYPTIQTVFLPSHPNYIWLFARNQFGVQTYQYDTDKNVWNAKQSLSSLSDANGWNSTEYASTIQTLALNTSIALLVRGPNGLEHYEYSPETDSWEYISGIPSFSDGNNWDRKEYYSTIKAINHEGTVSVVARGPSGVRVYKYGDSIELEETEFIEEESNAIETGPEVIGDWTQGPALPNLADPGFDDPKYYETIQVLSFNEAIWLFARGVDGMQVYNYNPSSGSWSILPTLLDLNDTSKPGDSPRNYSTIQVIYYFNYFWLLARNTEGLHLYQYNPLENAWYTKQTLKYFSGTDTWSREEYYSSIQAFGYTGKIWVFARTIEGEVVYQYNLDPNEERWSSPSASFVEMADRNGWNSDPKYYLTIQVVRVETRFWLFARGARGMHVYWYDSNTQKWDGDSMVFLPELSDENGWDLEEYYSTLQTVFLPSHPDYIWLFGRNEVGVQTYRYDTDKNTWKTMESLPNLSDKEGWDSHPYYSTIQTVALNTSIALVARGPDGLHYFEYTPVGDRWDDISTLPSLSDENGWDYEKYYETIRAINHANGKLNVLARGPDGMQVYYMEK